MTENYSGGSPGYLFKRLISNSSPEQLIQLLDDQIVALINSIDPLLLSTADKLIPVCIKLIDPKKSLKESVSRNVILSLLPNDKVNELLIRLGYKASHNPLEQLRNVDFLSKRSTWESLLDFFGLQDEERAPQPLEEQIESCFPEYGLFSHQRDAAHRVELTLSEHPYKALLHMPTGAGKTRTAINIAVRHLSENENTLICWLAQSAELLEQAAQEFKRAWKYIGNREVPIYRYWGNYTPDLTNMRDGIIIAGFAKINALYQRDANMLMTLGDRTSLTIVDEAHQAIAPTYRSIIEGLHTKRPKNKLLGLSATPGRTWNDVDADAELADFFGSKKITLEIPGYSNSVTYLIDEGYLAKPDFKLIESTFNQSDDLAKKSSEEYSDEFLEQVGKNSDRNQLILAEAEQLLKKHQRVILFASSVNHAKLMTAILSAKGYDADVVTGETPSGSRERAIRKFKGGDSTPQILCNYGVLTTGFDAPKTSATLIARPTKSLVLYSQMVGRAIRGPKQGGNKTADIVTVVDPGLPGFGSIAQAFLNWEDVWG